MKLERLITFFSTNPSAKLLRAQHAPYIIDFLHQHFKQAGQLTSLHSVLQQQLSLYLENLHETEPEILRERADSYLNAWSTGESRWLNRYFDREHAESVYQLTSHTEDVLTFLTTVLERNLGFVGTESRLSRIISTLSDIVVRGSSDRERRLEHLQAEKRRIEAEINSIDAGDDIETYSSTAIRERFAEVVAALVSLQGDFRAVEDSFKSITRGVQRRQAEAFTSRGEILGFALEAEEQLEEQDQGTSFRAFVRLILSQSQQDALEEMIGQLDGIAELNEQAEGKQRVKGMISGLSAEAEKILSVTRRLNATLRRLLDTRSSSSRMRVAELLGEIRALATRHAENPPDIGIEVLTDLDLLNVHQRTFWEPPVRFEDLELANLEQSEDDRLLAFKHLATMQRLDWENMRSTISQALVKNDQTPLKQLLEDHPVSGGPLEVLGYIQLAHEDGHLVDSHATEIVRVPRGDNPLDIQSFEVPRVVFLSQRLRLFAESLTDGEVGDE